MIYLDSAAVIKLIRREAESDQLVDWIAGQSGAPLVSSALVEVEVPRALRRNTPELLSSVPAVLQHLSVYEIDDLVRSTAAAYAQAALRSLDAIHLATAQAIFGPQLSAFVTYDRRLLDAASEMGLPIANPGQRS
jgi:predicted nucleic acid-binding protein